ncbi:MAG TPA: energy transducer TonB [Terriglobales bacterium]|jgi:protein TonB|nr:energy transducer TonB [Terriglobales bacterium]
MPTLLEIEEPQIKQPMTPAEATVVAAQQTSSPSPKPPERSLFSDSLLESAAVEQRRRGLATTFSFAFQCVVIGILLILPLMFTEALPTQQLLTMLVTAPPPPPPPPPAVAQVVKIAQTDVLNSGQLRTPTRIPRKVEMIREEESPPPAMSGGVIGGIPGGIPGGQLGGVIGGIISSSASSSAIIPRIEPVKRIRVSQGVTQGMVISKIEPTYPKIALSARVTGVVLVKAVISREGTITEIQVVKGHPMLVPAAVEAVKQWRYRPYLLNGAPVEVETYITVTFQISS